MTHPRLAVTILLLTMSPMVACSRPQRDAVTPPAATPPAVTPGSPITSTLPEPARLALDNGNALFRAKSYDAALMAYRQAAALAPSDVAPWFGIHMVATATSNKALADSAMAEMQRRGGAPSTPGDSNVAAFHGAKTTDTRLSPTAH